MLKFEIEDLAYNLVSKHQPNIHFSLPNYIFTPI